MDNGPRSNEFIRWDSQKRMNSLLRGSPASNHTLPGQSDHRKLANASGCRLSLNGMRTQINLSRQPFTNRRVLWIVLVAVYLTSFWLFLWIATEKDRVLAKESKVQLQIDG